MMGFHASDKDEPAFRSFVEEPCNCGRVWRGKPGTHPSWACPDCGDAIASEKLWRNKNHCP